MAQDRQLNGAGTSLDSSSDGRPELKKTALQPTSLRMELSPSEQSASSRRSGGVTVAGWGEQANEEVEKEERRRDVSVSLFKLEGRATTTHNKRQSLLFPISPGTIKTSFTAGKQDCTLTFVASHRITIVSALLTLTAPTSPPSAVPRPRLLKHSRDASRASVATFDSMLTTGESVYEDARERVSEEDWDDSEDDLDSFASLPTQSKTSAIPDTSTAEEEFAATTYSAQQELRPEDPHTPPQPSHPNLPDNILAPRSAFEEQAFLLQHRAALEAEATRRAALRHSLTLSLPEPVATTVASRRLSSTPRQLTRPAEAQLSIGSPASPLSASPARPWHPKPLVLTPARTIATPLTSSPPTSPHTRHASVDLQTTRHARTPSAVSAASSWHHASRPGSAQGGPVSPRGALGLGRSVSGNGPSRRRSLGYIDSVGDLATPSARTRQSITLPNSANGLGLGRRISWITSTGMSTGTRRVRSGSEDTGISTLTGDSSTTNYSGSARSGESPFSSASEWSTEREQERGKERTKGSPALDEQEWEQEYYRRAGTPLDVVDEGETSGGGESAGPQAGRTSPSRAVDAVAASPPSSQPLRLAPPIPIVSCHDVLEDHSSHSAKSPPPAASAPTADNNPSQQERALLPSSSPPKTVRRRPTYGPLWNGEPLDSSATEESDASLSHSASNSTLDHSSSRSTPVAASSSIPSSMATPSSERAGSARKGKPIVIERVTTRSFAAAARRSQRLSQADPPLRDGADRLSTRISKRLSVALGSPEGPPTPANSPRPPQSAQLERHSAQRDSGIASAGLAIWPPPPETKTVSLGLPLAHATDSELSSHSLEPGNPTDAEQKAFAAEQERERARVGHPSSSPRPSGFSFPGGSARSNQRLTFEPRDPRARRDDEDAADSMLEVLLKTPPPPPVRHLPLEAEETRRWSTHTSSTFDTIKKGSAYSLSSSGSTPTIQSSPSKTSTGGALSKKLFGLGKKSPSSNGSRRKPISIAPQDSPRRSSTKPRPVVSGPIDPRLQQQHYSFDSTSVSPTSTQQYWRSVSANPGRGSSDAPLTLRELVRGGPDGRGSLAGRGVGRQGGR
ncbi:hypothetical protein JCM11641_002146 [Rhodosporidiobolus odoratus]